MVVRYTIFDPLVDRPLHEVSREEAKIAFDHFIKSIPERIAQISRLAGLDESLAPSEDQLPLLSRWFPNFLDAQKVDSESVELPPPIVFSVCNDIAMYLGELLVSNYENLRWKMITSPKSDVSYQRPAVVGFQSVPNKRYNVDFDYSLCMKCVAMWRYGDYIDEALILSLYNQERENA